MQYGMDLFEEESLERVIGIQDPSFRGRRLR